MKRVGPDRLSAAIDAAWYGIREPEGASEFSHGRGLVAPELADKPPHEGGRYTGRTPPVEPKATMRRRAPVSRTART